MPSNEAAAQHSCSRIHGYARELTRHAPVPGGVIVIADRSGPLAHATFGHADLERGHPMTAGHLFEIGSISKVFTSLLIGQLAGESLLRLDDPVTAHLPWLDLGRDAGQVTIRALLNHTAGLVTGSDGVPDDLAQAWYMRDLAAGPQGAHFHYSNLGYLLLGLTISARTGEHLPDAVRRRLLGPMGMTESIPAVTHDDRHRLCTGYVPARQDRPWVPGDPLSPAPWFEVAAADGNIAATGADMARLVMLLLGGGEIHGSRVVARSYLDAMTTALAPGGEPVLSAPGLAGVTESRYGLGINVETIAGNRCLTHGGGMVGYSTFLLADTTVGMGVIVLTNANGDNLHAQLLARAVHTDLTSHLSGGAAPDPPDPDPLVRHGGHDDALAAGLGRFVISQPAGSRGPAETQRTVTITATGPGGGVLVEAAGRTGRLYRTLTGRYVTDHPDLRRFYLDPSSPDGRPRWIHGSDVFVLPDDGAVAGPAASQGAVPQSAAEALAGHYRSYSPWYPTLRILIREGRLWLAAPGGVEAPSDDEELVEVEPGIFRVGNEDWLPERLVAGPVVDGHVISVNRDGCTYSRTFTP